MVVVSSTFSAPAEGILLQMPQVQLLVNNDTDLGTATLYITQQNVVWGGGIGRQGGPSPTVSLMYPSMSLHAIQREPDPGLIIILNQELSSLGIAGVDDDEEYDADNEPMTKLQFVPPNEHQLQALYDAMTAGQALHPDPADTSDGDEDTYMDGEEFDEGEDEFEDAEESNMTPEDAAARLRQMRLENVNGAAHTRPHHEEDDEFGD